MSYLSQKCNLNKKHTKGLWQIVFLISLIFLLSDCQQHQQQQQLTFFVCSDTHFGITQYDSVEYDNRMVIKSMNHLPGTPYPDTVGGDVIFTSYYRNMSTTKGLAYQDTLGGNVQVPRGVLVCGDLTDHGTEKQWNTWKKYYGFIGKKGLLHYSVFEGAGNHDGGPDGPVRMGIRKRNRKRPFVTDISKTGLHYAFDWDSIHFVCLNVYPLAKWDSACEWCKYFNHGKGFADAEDALQFLEKDLKNEIGQSKRPIILYFHVGFTGWNKVWWTQKARDTFWEVIKPYNVIAIFRGHTHTLEFAYLHGVPVFGDGSTQKVHGPGQYLVVHIDLKKKIMTVIPRIVYEHAWGKRAEVIKF